LVPHPEVVPGSDRRREEPNAVVLTVLCLFRYRGLQLNLLHRFG